MAWRRPRLKRRTEVDPLMGVVIALGEQAPVPAAPAIRVLVGLVHDLEEGRRELSQQSFDVLLRECLRGTRMVEAARA